tara:strand:- start:1050 stop:2297 length:1248 start_codon:yes stop_codon:yes gene_type:complete
MNILSALENLFFPFYRSKNIKRVFSILHSGEDKTQAMFVGGCVRKYLLKEKIDDIDIATILTPDQVIEKFQNSDIEVKKTGIEHGTLTIVLNNQHFEITTLRKDVSTDGRHATVSFTDNWEEDSERRDFTVNAIYLKQNGSIFDPQSGVSDLKKKKIKFIGNPEKRIKEDYLRILRFIRFSIEYGSFDFESEALKAIQTNLNGIVQLSKERIYGELNKILKLKNLEQIFKNKIFFDIFKLVFPEFKYMERTKNFSIIRNLKLKILDRNNILALLLVDSSNNHEYFCHKYKVSNETRDYLDFCGKNFKEVQKNKNFFKKDLKKNIFFHKKNKIKSLFFIYSLAKTNFKPKDLMSMFSKIDDMYIPKFPITGKYLLEKGIKSGKKMGMAIKEIEKKWIDNNFSLNNDELNKLINQFK